MYIRALETIPEVVVHYGQFQTNKVWMPRVAPAPGEDPMVRVFRTEEKGSDVNIGSYLLLDAFKNDSDTAVVISNDSDLAELPSG